MICYDIKEEKKQQEKNLSSCTINDDNQLIMKLSANFQLSELVKSQVAERKGIPNNPSPSHIDNLKALCVNVLQPIRSHFDSPVSYIFRL
jgi:hypothetical protein